MIIGVLSLFGLAFAVRKAAAFIVETVSQRPDITKYIKIGTSSDFGLFGRNSKTQCSEVCINEGSCESFYIEDGACVFGVRGDVTGFAEGEETAPDAGQKIYAKGMCNFCHLLIFKSYPTH